MTKSKFLSVCGTCGCVFLLDDPPMECTACDYRGIVRETPFVVLVPETPADVADEGDELARECGEMLDTMDGQVRRVGP